MRLGELTYLTDQIVTFGFSSLELRNKAARRLECGVYDALTIYWHCCVNLWNSVSILRSDSATFTFQLIRMRRL